MVSNRIYAHASAPSLNPLKLHLSILSEICHVINFLKLKFLMPHRTRYSSMENEFVTPEDHKESKDVVPKVAYKVVTAAATAADGKHKTLVVVADHEKEIQKAAKDAIGSLIRQSAGMEKKEKKRHTKGSAATKTTVKDTKKTTKGGKNPVPEGVHVIYPESGSKGGRIIIAFRRWLKPDGRTVTVNYGATVFRPKPLPSSKTTMLVAGMRRPIPDSQLKFLHSAKATTFAKATHRQTAIDRLIKCPNEFDIQLDSSKNYKAKDLNVLVETKVRRMLERLGCRGSRQQFTE